MPASFASPLRLTCRLDELTISDLAFVHEALDATSSLLRNFGNQPRSMGGESAAQGGELIDELQNSIELDIERTIRELECIRPKTDDEARIRTTTLVAYRARCGEVIGSAVETAKGRVPVGFGKADPHQEGIEADVREETAISGSLRQATVPSLPANALPSAEPPPTMQSTSIAGETLLRLSDVKRKVGLGTSTIYRRVADDAFPRPVALGPQTVRWIDREVEEWINRLPKRSNCP